MISLYFKRFGVQTVLTSNHLMRIKIKEREDYNYEAKNSCINR
jgi:hypothetical protein